MANDTLIAGTTQRGINPELWARIWFVLAVGVLAYFVALSEVGRTAFEGSQSAYLVVAPVLAGLVAAGYSHPPRGVIDAESDWIGAVLLGVCGFATIFLISRRLPTMAALWHLDNIGLVIWVAVCGMVVFSARHMLRMWNVWLLGAILAPVMPFLLMTAQLGGSDTAIASVSAMLGTLAVYLGARFVDWRRRLLTTAVNVVASFSAVFLLDGPSLYIRVIIVAGVVPLLIMLALHRVTYLSGGYGLSSLSAELPRCRAQSYILLLVIAVVMLFVQLPMVRPAPVDEVRAGWAERAGLEQVEAFPFITNFLGPDATLTRYRVPGESSGYTTSVDVMSSPELARLRDYSDAVWYPTAVPVNYAPFEALPEAPAGIKSAHSDADSAKNGNTTNWNAVTWVWRNRGIFEQVTVITSQSKDLPAPAPRPLSVHNVLIQPALWLARQQSLEPGVVDPDVAEGTDTTVQRLLFAGEPLSAGDAAP